jgi:hypothetical protein
VTSRNKLALAIAASLALAAGALVLVPAAPAAAQEVVQDEGSAYRAWYEATQAKDLTKALVTARAYVAQYAAGQYAEAIKAWLLPAEFEAAVKEKRAGDMIKFGRELLAKEPENLVVLIQLAFALRNNELLASPASYEHVAEAVEFSNKAIALLEAGKTPAGAQTFDKSTSLAWLTQVLALNEAKNGTPENAIKLYDKSTALASGNAQLVGRNLINVYGIRQTSYNEAVKAFKALPEADKTASEPKPELKAALDRVNQEADALVDSAAGFVAFAKAKSLAPATRDKVNQTLEAVYKTRHPEDAALAGLQKLLQEKEAVLAAPATPGD